MNQSIAGFDLKSLLLVQVSQHFVEPEFENCSVYAWDEEEDHGYALSVQRYVGGETLVLTFGVTSSGRVFVEYWVRQSGDLSDKPTLESKFDATPVRTETSVEYFTKMVNYIIEIVKVFYKSSDPPLVYLDDYRKAN